MVRMTVEQEKRADIILVDLMKCEANENEPIEYAAGFKAVRAYNMGFYTLDRDKKINLRDGFWGLLLVNDAIKRDGQDIADSMGPDAYHKGFLRMYSRSTAQIYVSTVMNTSMPVARACTISIVLQKPTMVIFTLPSNRDAWNKALADWRRGLSN